MDELVVVGGLVPSLLVKQEGLPTGMDSHVGTMDLDKSLAFRLRGSSAAIVAALVPWFPFRDDGAKRRGVP